jgi:hypothetical protein
MTEMYFSSDARIVEPTGIFLKRVSYEVQYPARRRSNYLFASLGCLKNVVLVR